MRMSGCHEVPKRQKYHQRRSTASNRRSMSRVRAQGPHVKLGLLQHACSADPKEKPRDTARRRRTRGERCAQIICTQELFRSQYFCRARSQILRPRRADSRPEHEGLPELAKKHGVVVIASLSRKRAEGSTTTPPSSSTPDGSLLGIYRKMHIRRSALLREFYFTPVTWLPRLGHEVSAGSAC